MGTYNKFWLQTRVALITCIYILAPVTSSRPGQARILLAVVLLHMRHRSICEQLGRTTGRLRSSAYHRREGTAGNPELIYRCYRLLAAPLSVTTTGRREQPEDGPRRRRPRDPRDSQESTAGWMEQLADVSVAATYGNIAKIHLLQSRHLKAQKVLLVLHLERAKSIF